MSGSNGTVYLLHFEPAYKHAAHYIGFTSGDVLERIRKHQSGLGSRLVTAAVNAGCHVELARTWRGGRKFERRLKNRGGAGWACPICRERGIHQRRRTDAQPDLSRALDAAGRLGDPCAPADAGTSDHAATGGLVDAGDR